MKPIGTHNYFVYIITNKMKTVLYTGMTNNLERRLSEHEQPDTNRFTGKYKCHHLLYWERFQYAEEAIAREKQIKGWTRKKKDDLISAFNPERKYLNEDVKDCY
ncbi:MAG: GIY-YIG nuclease family protein [Flavobacteriales bacterium]|nr:GIY-YIG nuclease family protein [Flavobacteriales bacterium]